MAAPRKIAVFIDPVHFTRAFEILSGISDYARAKGTLMLGPRVLTSVHFDPAALPNWQGDGIIGTFYDAPVVTELLGRGIAVVNLTENLSQLELPVVVTENWQVGQLAAAHLMEQGYRRFGFVYDPGGTHVSPQRREGFVNELLRRGVSESAIDCHAYVDRNLITREWFNDTFGRPSAPLGLLAFDDDVAASLVIAVQANGLRVPQDVAVVGVNDLELICYAAPVPLTSVAPAYFKQGIEAAKLMEAVLNGTASNTTIIRVPPLGLVPRMSTQHLAFEDPIVERALAYMHANSHRRYGVDDIAQHCGKSRRTLEMRFIRTVGHSILNEMNRLHVERARQLLGDTTWAMNRVAEESGFGDLKQMDRVFRRQLSKSPSAVRQEMVSASMKRQ